MWILIASIIIFVAIVMWMFYMMNQNQAVAQSTPQQTCPCRKNCPCMGCGRITGRCGCPTPRPRCAGPNAGCPFC